MIPIPTKIPQEIRTKNAHNNLPDYHLKRMKMWVCLQHVGVQVDYSEYIVVITRIAAIQVLVCENAVYVKLSSTD